jgi:hypothetical protein
VAVAVAVTVAAQTLLGVPVEELEVRRPEQLRETREIIRAEAVEPQDGLVILPAVVVAQELW